MLWTACCRRHLVPFMSHYLLLVLLLLSPTLEPLRSLQVRPVAMGSLVAKPTNPDACAAVVPGGLTDDVSASMRDLT